MLFFHKNGLLNIDISFERSRGNIENDLTITNTGEVYLDGNLVVYSSDIDDDIVMANVFQ